jgi:hypothetical protein
MLRVPTLPGALSRVLVTFRPCFTAPTFQTFTMLVAGLFAQPVRRTVCGMLTGAGLARIWHHGRAHRFFSAARWNPQQIGLLLAELIVTQPMAAGASITVAIDDTLFRRRGKKVHAAGWFHDGSAAGRVKLGFAQQLGGHGDRGDVAVLLTSRDASGPGRAGGQRRPAKPDLARDLLDVIAGHFGDRDIHLVGDSAYGCGAFAGLGDGMTTTTRAKVNATFYQLAPPRTGKRGGPALKGTRIGTPTQIAHFATWKTLSGSRYGTTSTVKIAEQICLWFGTWRTDTVRVILVKNTGRTTKTSTTNGYDIALVTTDLTDTAAEIIARYAARWAIEVTFFDVKNILGAGEARNRVPKAVQRTVPFGLLCHSILIIWYALHGHDQDDAAQRRARAPWYKTKTERN